MNKILHIYVDGSASNNGKKKSSGGYGVVIFDNKNNLIDAYYEHFKNVTNNQMELKAFLKTFELLSTKYKDYDSIIYSDSAYCINMLTDWIYTWSQNNWQNSRNRNVKNLDIVLSLYEYCKINNFINRITFQKIKGHTGNLGNELADAIAAANKDKISKLILKNHVNIKFCK